MTLNKIGIICAIAFAVALTVTYGSFGFGSTFIQDDYGQISLAKVSFGQQIHAWSTLWGSRPVSLFFLTAIIQLLKTHWVGYVALNLTFLFFAIWVFFVRRSPFANPRTSLVALSLAAFPAISSTVVFSPVNQVTASVSLALAASGHMFFGRFIQRHGRGSAIMCASLFSLSLLTYEISLPMMVWSLLSNVNLELDKSRYARLKSLSLQSAPIVVAIIVAVTWQKVGAPYLLDSHFSRLATFKLLSLATWFYALFVSLPTQLVLAIARHPVMAPALAAFVFMLIRSDNKTSSVGPEGHHARKTKIWAASASLVSCSLLFMVSGTAVDLTGYLNRGLTSTWFCLVLFIVLLAETRLHRGMVTVALIATLVTANLIWFSDKVQENNKASQLRSAVITEIAQATNQLPRNSTLFVDVPCLLPHGMADSDIFCTEWDLQGGLSTVSAQVKSVYPIWDKGFEAKAAKVLQSSKDVYLIVVSNSGKLETVTALESLSQLTNLHHRNPGGKKFTTLECLGIFKSTRLNEPEASLVNCLANPY